MTITDPFRFLLTRGSIKSTRLYVMNTRWQRRGVRRSPSTPSVSYLVTFSDAGGKYSPRYSSSHQIPWVRLVVRSVNLYR